jgi:hypothetical protein
MQTMASQIGKVCKIVSISVPLVELTRSGICKKAYFVKGG